MCFSQTFSEERKKENLFFPVAAALAYISYRQAFLEDRESCQFQRSDVDLCAGNSNVPPPDLKAPSRFNRRQRMPCD